MTDLESAWAVVEPHVDGFVELKALFDSEGSALDFADAYRLQDIHYEVEEWVVQP